MSAAVLSYEVLPGESPNWVEHSPEFRFVLGMRVPRDKNPPKAGNCCWQGNPAPPPDQSQSHQKVNAVGSSALGETFSNTITIICQVQGASTEDSKCCVARRFLLTEVTWRAKKKGKTRIGWKNKNQWLRIAVPDSSQFCSTAPPGSVSGPFLQEPGPVNYELSLGTYHFPSSDLQLCFAACSS